MRWSNFEKKLKNIFVYLSNALFSITVERPGCKGKLYIITLYTSQILIFNNGNLCVGLQGN